MSSDGENAKNQTSEIGDKPNLDSTDSSQDSSQDTMKSEPEEHQDKKPDGEVKPKEKSPEPAKPEEKTEINDKIKEEKDEEPKLETNDDAKKVKDDKKKEEKSEEKTDEDTEGGEASDDAEDDDKKEVPLLDQPLEQSGTRDRKKVQRFNEEFTPELKESTKVDIPPGSGTQLGDIPRIDASISRFKTEDLKLLHRVLFKVPGKTIQIKKNIRRFNGFDFDKESEAYERKVSAVQKMEMKQLKSVCEMLDLDKKGNKEDIGDRICEFLLEPKDSGKSTVGGRPKRTAAVRANNRGYSSPEDDDDSDSARKSRAKRGKGRRINLKEESSSEDAEFNPTDEDDSDERPPVTKRRGRQPSAPKRQEDSDEITPEETPTSEEEDDEPKGKKKRASVGKVQNNKNSKKVTPKAVKTPAKKTPVKNSKKPEPAKRGRKKAKAESEDEEEKDSEENNAGSSSEDEPLVKKSKSPQPPSDEEIKTYVKEILEGANLEEITMKTVCKQVYAHYPEFDLTHKKDFIKTTVKSLIST